MNMPAEISSIDIAQTEQVSVEVSKVDHLDQHSRSAYSEYLKRHIDATAFHGLAWIDGVTIGTGHRGWLLIARRGNVVCGILPAHEVKSLLFGKALVSTGFAVDGGILADDQSSVEALAGSFWSLAQNTGCATAELRGGMLPSQNDWQVNRQTYLGYVDILADDDDAQLKAIPRKQRAEVRKGLKNNLAIEIGQREEDRDWHYRVYSESVRNLGTPVFPRKLFDGVVDRFGDHADILTVLSEGKPVSSVLSLYHNDIVMPYWGGGVWAARHLRANDVMYYALMNHARERGCKKFDFGRSKAGTGAAHFKKNWGFEGESLEYAVRTKDGVAPRDINPLSPKYQARIKLWQKLPLPVANILGPIIARGLG